MDSNCGLEDLMTLDSASLLPEQDEDEYSEPDTQRHDSDVNGLCENLRSVDMSRENCLLFKRDDEAELDVQDFTDTENDKPEDGHFQDLDSERIFTADRDGDNCLHIAIMCLYKRYSLWIIDKAALSSWISVSNKLFQTPLHLAVLTNQLCVVRKLLASGADVKPRDKDGNTALHIACRDGLYEIVRQILLTVKKCLDSQLNKLIKTRSQVNVYSLVNYEGYTALHLAAMNKHYAVVELLIDYDIDLNVGEGKTGRTILHNACLSGDIKLVRHLLKQKSCNINARAYDGLTPFDMARFRDHDEVCMVLAAAGARYGDDEVDTE